ncbi:MAG: hypothetical protein RLZZ496_1667 [Pseudomonadota bacterium]
MKRSNGSIYDATMKRLERRKALNRLNALKSTGPISKEGKSRSSQNARTHGLTALKQPLEVIGGDEREFCALILGGDQVALTGLSKGHELDHLARALYDLQTRLAYIQREKAKIYSELKNPNSVITIAWPSKANPFISGKRQARRVIGEWKRHQGASKEKGLLGPASRILMNLGKDEPDRVDLLKKLSRYERETLAQFRKIARRIAILKSSLTEQSTLHDLKSASTET